MKKWMVLSLTSSLSIALGAGLAVAFIEKPKAIEPPHPIEKKDDDDVVLTERQQKLLEFGYPLNQLVCLKENFISLSSFASKTPLWTLEHLSAETLKGTAQRDEVRFEPTKDLDERFRAQNSDYWRSGWSRGHMVPASNNHSSMQAMKESFELSTNIVPQNLDNNINYWHRLELWVKDLVTAPLPENGKPVFEEIWVVSGPAWLPRLPSSSGFYYSDGDTHDGAARKKYKPSVQGEIRYSVIGNSLVHVPTHLYKGILGKRDSKYYWASFMIPNAPVEADLPISTFRISKRDLERDTGVVFFPKLNEHLFSDLCTLERVPQVEFTPLGDSATDQQSVCSLITPAAHALFVLTRTVKKCKTRECIDKVLADESNFLKSDESFSQLFSANASKSNSMIVKKYLEAKEQALKESQALN